MGFFLGKLRHQPGLFLHFSVNDGECHKLGNDRKDPGDGIGGIQTLRGVHGRNLEHGENPQQPGTADAQNRNQHGYGGSTHAPQRTRRGIQQTIEEIGHGGEEHPGHADLKRLGGIGDVNTQKGAAEDGQRAAHDQTGQGGIDHAQAEDLFHPVKLMGSHVLTDVIHRRLMEAAALPDTSTSPKEFMEDWIITLDREKVAP